MVFKPRILYPIAVALTLINLGSVAFATPPWHAAIHAALALAFGAWAQRLRQVRGREESEARLDAADALETLETLGAEVASLRRELTETQERLDFVERLLAQGPEARRVGPR